ncbi:MAG: hypothetical protein AABW88_05005 [Nanoarchaeota archaeon]
MEQKPNKIKKWFLAIGIAIIFTLFVNYGISTFFNAPDYNKFCGRNQSEINYSNRGACILSGGQWTNTAEYSKPVPVGYQTGYCDIDFTCRKSLDTAQKIYDDRSFIVMVIAGFVGLVLGVVLTVESISSGFLLGGILNLFFATVRYWDRFSDVIRFVLLGVVLLVLVWIGYKKLK